MAETKDTLVEEILDKIDLVELIQEVTPLQKKGKNHFGLCPFHHEKTPSFSVSEDKQLYHCFSCKASGNALTFVKETKQMTSREALHYLADRANVPLDQTFVDDPKRKYYQINQDATDFFHDVLHHTKEGIEALTYLQQRGFKTATLEHFNVGLAPKKHDALTQTLRQKEVLLSDLLDLGLAQESETVYDVFYQRIIFPIHSPQGDVIGFSGRTYHDDERLAKYINTINTPVFEKSQVLYNYHRAKAAIKKHQRAILFEGFMDVMSAYQAGLEESLAIMGTALTEQHIQTLKSSTQQIVLCFDGDAAGQEATAKFVDRLEAAQFEVSVVTLDKGQDPDDFIQKYGNEAFQQKINEALNSHDYHYQRELSKVNKEKVTEVEKFKNAVFKRIANLSNYRQDHYLQRMSKDFNASYDILVEDFKSVRRKSYPTYKKIPKIAITNKFVKAERGFIRYFLKDESYVRRFKYHFEDALFNDKNARDIELEIFEYYEFNKHSCIVKKLFKERLSDAQKAYFETYVDAEETPLHEHEFEDFIDVMEEQLVKNRIEALKKRLEDAKETKEKIRIKVEIDQLNKEAKHGKRKNNSRTH